jgi:hypothetical protein
MGNTRDEAHGKIHFTLKCTETLACEAKYQPEGLEQNPFARAEAATTPVRVSGWFHKSAFAGSSPLALPGRSPNAAEKV